MKQLLLFLCTIYFALADESPRKFPENFLFGAATAAYQIEGAWDVADKGENIWDYASHHRKDLLVDGNNGDVACDSYHLYKRDVEVLSELGVDFYRFSIAWSRLLPTGYSNVVSADGTRYYNALIDELLLKGIKPVITLYHWDLPQPLQELGGWTNPIVAEYFAEYARVAFRLFGDRVKTWLTFNEPHVFCQQGYGQGSKAPAIKQSGIADYLCAHTVLMAHAKAYHIYDDVFRNKQNGVVGLTLSASWRQPATNSREDEEASFIMREFELGWFANPIFSEEGDYPAVMKKKIAQRSKQQGFSQSRLPSFSPDEVEFVRGTYDFFGLNHYTTYLAKMNHSKPDPKIPNYNDDSGVENSQDPSWPPSISTWLKVTPWGFRKILNWIRTQYGSPDIMIFENGFSDDGTLEDHARISYHRDYLNSMLDAMDDGCKITSYAVWSLMDNLEWFKGYSEKFGLYHVDFNDPTRPRKAKLSAEYFKEIIKTRSVLRNKDA